MSTGYALSGTRGRPELNFEYTGIGHASITCDMRQSDSPYIETVMHGRTVSDDSPIRPAECHWHMVFARKDGGARVVFVGPWTTAGVTYYDEGAEILWIKFGLGTFMPHLPARRFLDTETILPDAASRSFWLKGSAWQFPNHENARRSWTDSCITACWFATRSLAPCCGTDRRNCRPGRYYGTVSCGPLS